MSFEPEFTKINLNSKKGSLCEQIKVSAKTEILAEEISSVLSVSAFSTVLESEVDGGAVHYGGRVIFYISYVAADGSLKKCECGSEFKGSVKDALINGARANVTTAVVKTETDLSGIKFGVNAYVDVCVSLSGSSQIDALVGGENLVVNSGEVTYLKGYGQKSLTFPVEEEFELNYAVEEVLSHRAQAVITMAQCGVNCIIVDGEVILSVIMLQKNDRNDIIKEVRTMPFRAEIECEDAMPNMTALATVKEKSFKTDVSVDEENQKSVVSASVNLIFDGEAFFEDTISLATDVFSTEQEVEVVKKIQPYLKNGDLRSAVTVVSGRSAVSELPVGAVALAAGGEKVEIISKRCDGENTVVTGVLSAVGYFRDGEGKAFTKPLEIPFEVALDCAYPCDAIIDVTAVAARTKIKIISLTEVELDAEITFTIYPNQKQDLSFVCEIKPLGEKKKNTSAISVYIAMEGEELWSLAKRLNVCPDALILTNPDLQFPLTGKERIVVYRQK